MKHALLLVAAALSLSAPAFAQSDDAPKGDPVRGRKIFVTIGCFQCHGYAGVTGGPGGRLAPNPLPYDAVLGQLRTPRGRMPVYTAEVTPDQDVADIYAWLKSQPQPPAVASIPLLAH